MVISSRTPEGFPSECRLCGAAFQIEFSEPGEDAPCPACGHLVWFSAQVLELLRRRFAETLGASDWPLDADTPLRGMFGADSLDLVELVMELEEQLDIDISDENAQDIRTIGDLIRYLERIKRGESDT